MYYTTHKLYPQYTNEIKLILVILNNIKILIKWFLVNKNNILMNTNWHLTDDTLIIKEQY